MSDQTSQWSPFQIAARDAQQKFRITARGGNSDGVYLNAEAGTGSRYAVVITPVPNPGHSKEGGAHLISLLQPWQANMVFTVDGGEIHPDYVLEKLSPRDKAPGQMHGGDAAALVMAVNAAADMMAKSIIAKWAALDEVMKP